ncbi:MAG: carbohydrate ABC transporter permease [Firmicutes bacterium]|nr:carbohydrate ABC transporter permease [Bacillota bacterium]MDH7495608.1 carbohydrate ABC transporter permease [Bacillota bacterium]
MFTMRANKAWGNAKTAAAERCAREGATRKVRSRDRLRKEIAHVLLLLVIIIPFVFPFLWMAVCSLKRQADIIRMPPSWVFRPTLLHYQEVFRQYQFTHFIWNSLVVAAGSTFLSLVLGLPAAYSIARFRQRKLALVILVARIVPGITFLIPWFILFSRLRLVDTYTSLILSHMLVGLPFMIWVMVPFFESLPKELEEAAMVDGSTRAGAFSRVLLPLTGPGVLTSSILSFVFSWNNFMFAVVLTGARTRTLPIAVFNFLSYSEINWGGLMAAAVVITVPILVIALIAQRYIVAGLTAGAVKG